MWDIIVGLITIISFVGMVAGYYKKAIKPKLNEYEAIKEKVMRLEKQININSREAETKTIMQVLDMMEKQFFDEK